ncbi:MAG: Hsp20/alpha crystallin family protein [Planctomycetaceae bacterium]|nr:MAG: Hsp20/alpha crystallin family protein [Planctomycetaceae bacterium]
MFGLVPKKRAQDVAVRQDEGNPLIQFRREFDDLWNRFWGDWSHGLQSAGDGGWPNLSSNIEDQEKQFVLRAELPGFDPDEIDVQISGNLLTVRAEHKAEEKQGEGQRYQYGRFQETFTLPQGVLSDQIDARYHSGVLEVHLPKSEEAKAKRIAVKSG